MKTPEPRMDSVPSLENLDIPLPILADAKNPQKINKEKKLKALFDGVPVEVGVQSESVYSATINQFDYIHIAITTVNIITNNMAFILITVVRRGRVYEVATNVENSSGELRGVGRVLWEISLKLIKKITDKCRAPVVHKVSRAPWKGLTKGK